MKRGAKPSIKIGDRFTTNEGYVVEVVKYNNAYNVTVQFDNGFEKRVRASELRTGRVKNPYHPSVFGVGYFGVGKHKASASGERTQVYKCWRSMLQRCYDPKSSESRPTYRECYVCEEWHNFQNFADWYEHQPNAGKKGFNLDKDLIYEGNKVYSPDSCSFVPQQINRILTDRRNNRGNCPQGVFYCSRNKVFVAQLNTCQSKNKSKRLGYFKTSEEAFSVYKREKEKFVRQQAEKYKDDLHPQVYNNLINYTLEDRVEI